MKMPQIRLVLPLLTLSALQGCKDMPDYHVRPKPGMAASRPANPVRPVENPSEASGLSRAPSASSVAPLPALPSTPMVLKPPSVVQQPSRRLADGRDMPAVQGLLASAESHLGLGELDEAANSLERAQRLAPQSAAVYVKFSEVRLKQGRAVEAEQFARKGLAFAQGAAQQGALWRLIAAASERLGKVEAARQARQKADQLEGIGDRG